MITSYQCESCGGVFTSERSDEEARAEAKSNFPDVTMAGMAIVCDDCYREFMQWFSEGVALPREEEDAN